MTASEWWYVADLAAVALAVLHRRKRRPLVHLARRPSQEQART